MNWISNLKFFPISPTKAKLGLLQGLREGRGCDADGQQCHHGPYSPWNTGFNSLKCFYKGFISNRIRKNNIILNIYVEDLKSYRTIVLKNSKNSFVNDLLASKKPSVIRNILLNIFVKDPIATELHSRI